jgi:hypothetical protein
MRCSASDILGTSVTLLTLACGRASSSSLGETGVDRYSQPTSPPSPPAAAQDPPGASLDDPTYFLPPEPRVDRNRPARDVVTG